MSTASPGGELVVTLPHTPTEESRRQVEMMAACGLTSEQIYKCMGQPGSLLSFERLYRQEIDLGALRAIGQVGGTVLSIAIDRDHDQCMTAATFFLRARGGWRDVRKVETDAKADLPQEKKDQLIDDILRRLTPELMKAKVAK